MTRGAEMVSNVCRDIRYPEIYVQELLKGTSEVLKTAEDFKMGVGV